MTSSTLHIINKAASNSQLYRDCLDSLHDDDGVIFIESAVYTACGAEPEMFSNFNITAYALKTDILARGIQDKISEKITVVDDGEFVELCCLYKKSVSWF